jgi:hypothetical protein
MWYCFIPMLILAGLAIFKLLLFKVKNPYVTAAVALSIIAIPICVESYFDNTAFDAPLCITALPFCFIVLSVTFS